MAYKKFRENPEANPLKTPSGKIEIYSSSLAKIANTWEIPEGEVISRLEGIRCGFKPTSCPDQLAKAIRQALNEG